MTRKTSIYSIEANHARAIKSELDYLSESATSGDIVAITYAAKTSSNEIMVGYAGTVGRDDDKAIGMLFRAAVSVMAS